VWALACLLPVTSSRRWAARLASSVNREAGPRLQSSCPCGLWRCPHHPNTPAGPEQRFGAASRLQTGNLVFDRQPVALNALVNDIVEEIQPLAARHRLVIAETEPVIVTADPLKTAQVLRNLLLNAIKYSPDADRVIVRITQEDRAGRVRIQDFGVGIPFEDQERVFERFGRVQTARGQFPGLGLGLYITKGLVEGQGGTIGGESRPGAGSTFSFTLPLWDEGR
jgi:signal transduction histidine kinase